MTLPEPIPPALLDAVLVLNNEHAEALSLLDPPGLQALLDGAFHARRIGNLEAVLIALDEAHPSYASPNYLWFRARRPRFVYVDRVVVSASARGRGYARRLYEDLIARARGAGHTSIVCEVNSNPPNPGSDAFHAAMGFKEVGAAAIHDGAKMVRYLELTL